MIRKLRLIFTYRSGLPEVWEDLSHMCGDRARHWLDAKSLLSNGAWFQRDESHPVVSWEGNSVGRAQDSKFPLDGLNQLLEELSTSTGNSAKKLSL